MVGADKEGEVAQANELKGTLGKPGKTLKAKEG
jgi:hypothetical protein